MLRIANLTLARGARRLLEGVSLTIHPGQKLGVIGANGSGKTSLFALLRGELVADAGEVALPAGWVIAHVAQETPGSSRAAIDYVQDGDVELRVIEHDKQVKAEAFKTLTSEREWKSSFQRPVTAEISDVFGVQRVFNGAVQSTHQGLDFRVPTGTQVSAVNSGTVILAQFLYFEGNCIVIDHGQGLLTLYLHLSELRVNKGDRVSKGQLIGLSGGTGRATGPHLHLAVRWQGVYLNPAGLLSLPLP